MASSPVLKRSLLVGLTIGTLFYGNFGFASNTPSLDPLTKQAADLFHQDKLQEAAELEEKAVTEHPQDWLAHAALSYYYWQEGNSIAAATEGEKAVSLAPHNVLALTNLAKIKEALDDCKAALPIYEEAKKLAPSDWTPQLGIARCYLKSGNEAECLATMAAMASKTDGDFDWYQQLGDTYLRLDKPGPAVDTTRKAFHLATTEEQKSASSRQLLMALLRDNKIDEARELQNEVFGKFKPKNYELYVRTAAALLSPDKPQDGASLLNTATENLQLSEDGEGFFRLGRIFEQKASTVPNDSTKFAGWMQNAATAYQKAVALSTDQLPTQAKAHVALVGVLERSGNVDGMLDELKKAQALDQFSQLAPFLSSHIQADKANLAAKMADNKISPEHRCDFNLTTVNFNIEGLNCNCQITRAEEALSKVKGVAFVHVPPHLKPYQGTLLVDQSVTPIAEVFSQASKSFHDFYAAAKTQLDAKYILTSSKPIHSAEEAVNVAQESEHGDVLHFFTTFKPVAPVMPVNTVAEDASSRVH